MLIAVGSKWLREQKLWDNYVAHKASFGFVPPPLSETYDVEIYMSSDVAKKIGVFKAKFPELTALENAAKQMLIAIEEATEVGKKPLIPEVATKQLEEATDAATEWLLTELDK